MAFGASALNALSPRGPLVALKPSTAVVDSGIADGPVAGFAASASAAAVVAAAGAGTGAGISAFEVSGSTAGVGAGGGGAAVESSVVVAGNVVLAVSY